MFSQSREYVAHAEWCPKGLLQMASLFTHDTPTPKPFHAIVAECHLPTSHLLNYHQVVAHVSSCCPEKSKLFGPYLIA